MLDARGAASEGTVGMVVRMWGKRRSAEEASAGAENTGPDRRAQDSGVDRGVTAPPRVSEAIASVQPTPSRDAPPSARGDVGFNGASRQGADERSREVPQSETVNGAAKTPSTAASNQAPQGPSAQEVAFAVTFTRIVSILGRSPHYKHYKLSDLQWLVVPPILTGQSAVMEARINGRPVPVAVALWASVSEEVDKRLSENLSTPIKLRPDEWRSGNILWLVDAVGDAKAIPRLLRQLQETQFKGRKPRLRSAGSNSLRANSLHNAESE